MTGTGEVRAEIRDGVLVLTLVAHPVQGLTPAICDAARAALAALPAAVRAVILTGAGRDFCPPSGADSGDGVALLCLAIEASAVPVIAALHGAVSAVGIAVALACHARSATESTSLRLADILHGQVPRFGESQRLPRLLGAAEALALMLTARVLTATEALVIGLVDHVVDEGGAGAGAAPGAGGVAAARALIPGLGIAPRIGGLRDPAAFLRAVARTRADLPVTALPAAEAMIDCVEAALLLPLPQGLVLEAALRADLADTPEVAGLAASARAARIAAMLPPEIAAAHPPLVAHLGLAGTGPGLVVLALLALARGLQVTWAAADTAALAEALRAVAKRQEAEVTAGRLTPAAREAAWARLSTASDPSALALTGLIVAAGQTGGHAAGQTGGHAAGQTEGHAADLRAATPGVARVWLGGGGGASSLRLALLPSARACELAVPDGAAPMAVSTAVQVLRRIGLPPVLTGPGGQAVAGGVGGAVLAAGLRALMALRLAGVPVAALAAAPRHFGVSLPAPALARLQAAQAAAEVAMPQAEVQARWLGALVNQAAALLEAQVLRRPADLDHLLVSGYGFARPLGGPMHLADARGLILLRADLRRWQKTNALWAPHPLFDRLIASGRRLASLNT